MQSNKKQFEEGTRERKYFYDWTGKKHSPEAIEKMRIVHKGKGTGTKNSQFGSFWITNGVENKKLKKDTPIPTGWYIGRVLK